MPLEALASPGIYKHRLVNLPFPLPVLGSLGGSDIPDALDTWIKAVIAKSALRVTHPVPQAGLGHGNILCLAGRRKIIMVLEPHKQGWKSVQTTRLSLIPPPIKTTLFHEKGPSLREGRRN